MSVQVLGYKCTQPKPEPLANPTKSRPKVPISASQIAATGARRSPRGEGSYALRVSVSFVDDLRVESYYTIAHPFPEGL